MGGAELTSLFALMVFCAVIAAFFAGWKGVAGTAIFFLISGAIVSGGILVMVQTQLVRFVSLILFLVLSLCAYQIWYYTPREVLLPTAQTVETKPKPTAGWLHDMANGGKDQSVSAQQPTTRKPDAQ